MIRIFSLILLAGLSSLAAEKYIPKMNDFADLKKAVYYAGEIVEVDQFNRTVKLRLDNTRPGNYDVYHRALPQTVILLPYAAVHYNGALANLRDIPLGTHVHVHAFLPPESEKEAPKVSVKKYQIPETYAMLLEDDLSYYHRRGQSWKITAIEDDKKSKAQTKVIKLKPEGKLVEQGIKKESVFSIDASTRIWKGNQILTIDQLAVGQLLQFNSSWHPEWTYNKYHLTDIWLDEEAVKHAAERQKQRQIRHTKFRWLPGKVNSLKHLGGGKALVNVSLFWGYDQSLYDHIKKNFKARGGYLGAVDKTLMSWWQGHDGKYIGRQREIKIIDNPPPGHSGIELTFEVHEVLEGYRAGRFIRLRAHDWPNVKLPSEETMRIRTEY